MLPSLRHRFVSISSSSSILHQWINRSFCSSVIRSTNNNEKVIELLKLDEVEKILNDVRADDVKVIPVRNQSEFANFVVVATGKSQWHVRNIAQALIYKVKQKQMGAKRMLLPSVEGQEGGNWIVIDSGSLIVHALDEKARAYYNLEQLWTSKNVSKEQSQTQSQDLDQAFVKVRRKNNSKKPQKVEYFKLAKVESGLEYFKRAVEKEHSEATNVYGMLLFSQGDDQSQVNTD